MILNGQFPGANGVGEQSRRLLGPDGKPIDGGDGFSLPHYQTFAAIYNAVAQTYSYRWDEALKALPSNALAMRRDCYISALLQERYLQLVNLEWHLEGEDAKNPAQMAVAANLEKVIKRTPKWKRYVWCHCEGMWYGRYGTQSDYKIQNVNGRQQMAPVRWTPVNGDKIQYGFDDDPERNLLPRVYVNAGWSSKNKGPKENPYKYIHTDRAAAVVLDRPEIRQKFVIHQHIIDDADYFDAEMGGGVGGVGIRHKIYWAWWLRDEMLGWMMNFMQKVGTMGLLLFYYDQNSKASKDAAEKAAQNSGTNFALTVPRPEGNSKQTAGAELLPASSNGVTALRDIISDYFEKQIEREIVGQSMSSGSDSNNSLGGTGKAHFAQETKWNILKADAGNLGDSYTSDLVEPLKQWNEPQADFPVYFKFDVPKPEAEDKIKAGAIVVGLGVQCKADELRETAGFSKPEAGDETVGGVAALPGAAPGAAAPGGSPSANPNLPPAPSLGLAHPRPDGTTRPPTLGLSHPAAPKPPAIEPTLGLVGPAKTNPIRLEGDDRTVKYVFEDNRPNAPIVIQPSAPLTLADFRAAVREEVDSAITLYVKDAKGHEHKGKGSSDGGQFVGGGGGGGSATHPGHAEFAKAGAELAKVQAAKDGNLGWKRKYLHLTADLGHKNSDSALTIAPKMKKHVTDEIAKRMTSPDMALAEFFDDVDGISTHSPTSTFVGPHKVRAAAILVNCWANTSSDHDPLARAVQQRAAEILGVKDHFTYPEDPELDGKTQMVLASHGPVIDDFIRATYEHTQETLKNAGVTELVVYRGMSVESTHTKEKQSKLAALNAQMKALAPGSPDKTELLAQWTALNKSKASGVEFSHENDMELQPLSSFSTTYRTADSFSLSDSDAKTPLIMACRVPRERIFSTALTGSGCLDESEVIVTGGRMKALTAIFHDETVQSDTNERKFLAGEFGGGSKTS